METMEHPLATESFSYSWLINPKPPSSSVVDPLREPLSDDFKGELTQENHNDPKATHNFNFDISITNNPFSYSSTSPPLVHADELFSNGLIVPANFATPLLTPALFPSKETGLSDAASRASNQISVPSSSPLVSSRKTHEHSIFPRKLRRFSGKILQRYLGCLVEIRGTRVDDFDRRAQEVKSFSNTPETASPRVSTASAHFSGWSDYYKENSIYEAILYCKRSNTGQ